MKETNFLTLSIRGDNCPALSCLNQTYLILVITFMLLESRRRIRYKLENIVIWVIEGHEAQARLESFV